MPLGVNRFLDRAEKARNCQDLKVFELSKISVPLCSTLPSVEPIFPVRIWAAIPTGCPNVSSVIFKFIVPLK